MNKDLLSGRVRGYSPSQENKPRIRSTTVLCVHRDGRVVMAADGQVTLGEGVIKHSARKIRRLYQDKILAGFAGSTADAFNLFTRFEAKLEQYHGNIGRSAVELAKDWRTDKDRKSTRLNSSHPSISYAVFCLKKKKARY